MINQPCDTRQQLQQRGQALTELILVVPLALILIVGVYEVRIRLMTSLSELSRKLNDSLSIEHVPKWQRAHWSASGFRPNISSKSSESVSYIKLELKNCSLSSVNSVTIEAGRHNFEPKPLLKTLDRIRLLSLSVCRAACITEATPKAGPVNAPLLLTGLSGLPVESLRKEGLAALCPIVARTSENLRAAAVTMVQVMQKYDAAMAIKSVDSHKVICVR